LFECVRETGAGFIEIAAAFCFSFFMGTFVPNATRKVITYIRRLKGISMVQAQLVYPKTPAAKDNQPGVFATLDALDCPRPPRRAAPLCRPRSRERPHLELTVAGPRPLGGELDRHVEIGSLDNPQAAEMLLRLDEGPVGEQRLAAPVVDYGRRAGRREAAGENPVVSRVSGSFAVLRLMCLWARSVRPPLSGWLREPTRLGAWKCCADSRTS
jgi:hypothetical protein